MASLLVQFMRALDDTNSNSDRKLLSMIHGSKCEWNFSSDNNRNRTWKHSTHLLQYISTMHSLIIINVIVTLGLTY